MQDLNQPLSRQGFFSEKYELRKSLFGRDDVIPLWVADMDLPTPDFIIQALKERLEHPNLGYMHTPDEVYDAILYWQAQQGYQVHKKHIVFTHNVANAFFMAVQAFSQPGEAVLVQPPIYPPFMASPEINQRKLVEAPLSLENNRYTIDFAALEEKIVQHQVKLFLFCHPQNPSGRVWQKTELQQLAALCIKHQVIIVSDEVHSDMVYPPNRHIPLASLSPEIAQQTLTISSPGKTFNLGGLQIGYAICANPDLKKRYLAISKANAIYDVNLFAQYALMAAYSEQGKKWRDSLLAHFATNIDMVEQFFNENLPQVKVMKPEASYLIWLDFNALFSNHKDLKHWLINDCQLGLSDGETFGGDSKVGTGFMRLNIAITQKALQTTFEQLKKGIQTLHN